MFCNNKSIPAIINILDPELLKLFFKDHYPLFIVVVFLGSCLFTYYLIPKIIWVTTKKKLMKPVIGRSSHIRETPTFGGVAFFMTLMLAICTLQGLQLDSIENYLIAAITILFMVGIKDDLVVSSCRVKLFGQLAATALIVLAPQMHITNLYGFLGIHEIPEMLGYALSAFLMVALINAYNLIDGINGLAGIIGIIICSCYGIIFYLAYEPYFVFLSFIVVGILLAFLRFNFSSGKNKIFMGDSGSLIIGLVIGFLTLKILTLPHGQTYMQEDHYLLSNRYLFVFAVLFIPIFDTTRVMIIRIFKGKSPFSADRNHIHHILLDLGFKHHQASVFLGVINLSIFLLFLMIKAKFSTMVLTLIMLGVFMLAFVLFEISSKFRHKQGTQLSRENSKKPTVYVYDMNK